MGLPGVEQLPFSPGIDIEIRAAETPTIATLSL